LTDQGREFGLDFLKLNSDVQYVKNHESFDFERNLIVQNQHLVKVEDVVKNVENHGDDDGERNEQVLVEYELPHGLK